MLCAEIVEAKVCTELSEVACERTLVDAVEIWKRYFPAPRVGTKRRLDFGIEHQKHVGKDTEATIIRKREKDISDKFKNGRWMGAQSGWKIA